MGKRLFQKMFVSVDRTEKLGLPDLQVVTELDRPDTQETTYHTVCSSYFTKEKPQCPVCGGIHTTETKIIPRTFKDLLPSSDNGVKVIDLVHHQRYFRCMDCDKTVVFHENIDFAEEGCKFTNRLSDVIAEGTLTRTYEQVCKDYGVPASKASVGIIMRRRMRLREDLHPPLLTPDALAIFTAGFFSETYPMILGIYGRDVRLLDVLNGSTTMAYRVFFSQIDCNSVKQVYIDPDEQMHSAVLDAFPQAKVMLSKECLQRCVSDAFKDIIKKEGNRCNIHDRYGTLTTPEHLLRDWEHRQTLERLKKLHRVRAAYNAYQDLLRRMNSKWSIETMREWLTSLSDYVEEECPEGETIAPLVEFDILNTVLDQYERQITVYLNGEQEQPAGMPSAINGILGSIQQMPYCIYDVLRARMLLNVQHEQVEIDGKKYRTGVQIGKLTEKMNHIAWQIKSKKEREEYGYDAED